MVPSLPPALCVATVTWALGLLEVSAAALWGATVEVPVAGGTVVSAAPLFDGELLPHPLSAVTSRAAAQADSGKVRFIRTPGFERSEGDAPASPPTAAGTLPDTLFPLRISRAEQCPGPRGRSHRR